MKKISSNEPEKDLVEALKSNPTTIYRALSGDEKYFTDEFIEKLNDAFGCPLNLDWILKGESEPMLKNEDIEEYSTVYSSKYDLIREKERKIEDICAKNDRIMERLYNMIEQNSELITQLKNMTEYLEKNKLIEKI